MPHGFFTNKAEISESCFATWKPLFTPIIYILMDVYTGYNLAVKATIYFIYNEIHWYH